LKPSAILATKNKKNKSTKNKTKSAPFEPTLKKLKIHYPDAHCALDHSNAFELLVATILSAQCTDERVNKVTPALFFKYPTALILANAQLHDVENLIMSTNFYKNKSKNLIGMAQMLVDRHQGEVPKILEQLVELPGVGRKTANVVLGNAFNIASGVVVDTHIGRLSQRLGWTLHEDPVKIEQDLIKLIPQDEWVLIAHLLIFHGRKICKARNPDCSHCFLFDLCPKRYVKL
jgi:endonuclease III